jgi:hypothetical protein
MTPQERKLIEELFDRLESLEDAPRDDDAVTAINEGLERAPNAMYPLVQTVLVQDEALKRADARIRELEDQLGIGPAQAAQPASFLDNMRDTLFGERAPQGPASAGSVPSVRPGVAAVSSRGESPWGAGRPRAAGMSPGGAAAPPGGSFLGTAAATAAGVVGGALLMNSVRGLFGGSHGSPSTAFDSGNSKGTPWGDSAGGGDLARDAGINDINAGSRTAAYDDAGQSQRAGLFDTPDSEADDAGFDDDLDDGDFDFGDDIDTA